MILRDYQERAIAECLSSLYAMPVLVAPTGSGKTVMGVEIVKRSGLRTLWVAHRRELILQAAVHFDSPGIIMPGYPREPKKQVQVASVQTLARRGIPEVDLIVIDEAHHAAASTYEKLQAPAVLGLTATPFRLDGSPLRQFGKIVVASTVQDLCDAGVLHAPVVYWGGNPDTSGVKKSGGDFNLHHLEGLVMTKKLVGDLVENWKRLAPMKRTVAFGTTVPHSKSIAETFQAAGVPWKHVDASTPTDEREQVLKDWRAGRIVGVSNCMLFNEGFDFPGLEVAIIARPTLSLCLHLQMVGRIMRSHPGKTSAVVLDHAGNHQRHGFVTDDIEYSLDGRVVPKKGAALGVSHCPDCFVILRAGWTVCPVCGAQKPEPKIPKTTAGNLALATQTSSGVPFATRSAWWSKWRSVPGARARFKERFGQYPSTGDGGELVDPSTASGRDSILRSLARAAVSGEKPKKPGWVWHMFTLRTGAPPPWHLINRYMQEFESETSKPRSSGHASEQRHSDFGPTQQDSDTTLTARQ